MFTVRIDTDNDAFEDGYGGLAELGRILNKIRERMALGDESGVCIDSNGNTVGGWELTS